MNVQERLKNAAGLVESGEYAEATSELTWLWNHMLEENKAFGGVRSSYVVSWMKRLAELDQEAHQTFKALRDKLTPRLEPGSTDYAPIMDWFTLSNKLLEDHSTIGSWVDGLLASENEPFELRIMKGTILSWLTNQGRWADAGRILEPGTIFVARARLRIEEEKHNDQHDEDMRQRLVDMQLMELVRTHASYLAANRDDEAWEVADLLLGHFDKSQACTAIQEIARIAGVFSAKHDQMVRDRMTNDSDD